MNEFRDKVAVITGAASGIGQGLAEHCAGKGMKIVLADIEAEALAAAESALRTKGAQVTAVVTDVANIADVQNLVARPLEAYARVDLLFNNAGVATGAAIWECSLETVPLPGSEDKEAAFRKMMASGMPPEQVAQIVFQAIAEEKFYIFTHPEIKTLVQMRMDDILAARPPVLPPMEPPE